MTHEELLAKIHNVGYATENGHTIETVRIIKQLSALRAVVELHKPRDFYGTQVCDGCDTKLNWQIDYPCSTIQAIEKELQ